MSASPIFHVRQAIVDLDAPSEEVWMELALHEGQAMRFAMTPEMAEEMAMNLRWAAEQARGGEGP
jgi:hypothetical protein